MESELFGSCLHCDSHRDFLWLGVPLIFHPFCWYTDHWILTLKIVRKNSQNGQDWQTALKSRHNLLSRYTNTLEKQLTIQFISNHMKNFLEDTKLWKNLVENLKYWSSPGDRRLFDRLCLQQTNFKICGCRKNYLITNNSTTRGIKTE